MKMRDYLFKERLV